MEERRQMCRSVMPVARRVVSGLLGQPTTVPMWAAHTDVLPFGARCPYPILNAPVHGRGMMKEGFMATLQVEISKIRDIGTATTLPCHDACDLRGLDYWS